jgi:RNA polymerase sigma-70 factor (ECF subfamily)
VEALVDTLSEAAVNLDSSLECEFEQRLSDSSRLVFRVAFSVLRNAADAEDVAQDAFVKAYQHFRRLRDRDRFRTWIVRVTWRLAIDRLRATARRERYEIAALHSRPVSAVENAAAEREAHAHLDKAIDALPEKLRQVLLLTAIEGYDMAETSQLLGVPVGTVRSRLHHARKQLVKRLKWLASAMRNS